MLQRGLLLAAFIALLQVDFAGSGIATWLFIAFPSQLLWGRQLRRGKLQVWLESHLIGTMATFYNHQFVIHSEHAPSFPWLLFAAAVGGLNVVAVGICVYSMRCKATLLKVLVSSFVFGSASFLERQFWPTWPLQAYCLKLVDAPFVGLTPWLGVDGISAVAWAISSTAFFGLVTFSRRRLRAGEVMAVCAGACFLFIKPATATRHSFPSCHVAICQPGATQKPIEELIRLTRLQKYTSAPDLFVWPEGICSENDMPDLLELVDELGISLLIGSKTTEFKDEMVYGLPVTRRKQYNSAVLLSRENERQCYHKRRLVPFIETPFLWSHTEQRSGFTPGEAHSNRFSLGKLQPLNVDVAICFEAFFPLDVDSGMLVVPAFDVTTRDHPEVMERQVRACRLRAIESNAWVFLSSVRSSSAIISPSGAVLVSCSFGSASIDTSQLPEE